MRMKDITFSRKVEFLGRNGMFAAKGFTVQPWYAKKVLVMSPITSKGVVGRCEIHIPSEDLNNVIAALQDVRNSLV